MRSAGPGLADVLRVENLSVAAHGGAVPLVQDIGFGLSAGDVLGVVGGSGSGKSLTCLALAGLLDPALSPRGHLDVDGIGYDLAAPAGLRSVRGSVLGMIFQDPRAALNPVRTVGGHFDEVLRRHGTHGARGRRAEATDLMDAVRVPDARQRLRQYPHELSGGLCQRISVALALAARPRVLIADEPTTALDMTVQAQILDLIDSVRDERGMAVILVSHDLAVICELAHRVLVMQAGRAIETADLCDLFEAPRMPYTRRLVGLARVRQDGHGRMAGG